MDFVEHLKSNLDIVKVIGEYVRLKRAGAAGRYVGLCPFHQEKTPSFSVNQTRQFYKCFGCGAAGDVLKFVMEIDGLTFPETLKLLAERNGIPMPKRSEYSDPESKLRGAILEMHEIAAGVYQENLRAAQGAEARAYLAKRAVSAEMTEKFALGFSDFSGQSLYRRLAQERFAPEYLDASGLVRKREDGSYYDYFRGRLMFPIHNESGKVIAFGGRAMRDADQPKYLNSPETPVYRKSSVLFNLHRARNAMRTSGRVVLVEGYMDVIGVFSAGVKEVVASCGTSLTGAQVRVMHRHADNAVINFDPDRAGGDAAEKAIKLFVDEGMHIRILALDGGLDPDEYVKQNGADAYRAKLDSAGTYFHWLADRARARFDMRSSDGRMEAFRKLLLPAVQQIPDRLERAAVASDLAGYLGVEPGLILDQLKKAAAERRVPTARAPQGPAVPAIERMLLSALIASEEARAEMLPQIPESATAEFVTREIFDALRNMNGGPAGFGALEGRLNPAARDLLHQIVAADEIVDESQALERAKACLRRLAENEVRGRVDDLQMRINAALREDRFEEAREMTRELSALKEELVRMRQAAKGARGA